MVKQMNSMQRVHFRHLLKNCRLYNFVEKFYGQCVNLIFLMLSCFSRVLLFATLWTVAHQVPLPWDSPGQNIEEGGHVLLQRIFPTQGMKPHLLSPAFAGKFFTTGTTMPQLFPLQAICINVILKCFSITWKSN